MKTSGFEHNMIPASRARSWGRQVQARRDAWLANLERVPEGHATIFYLFLAFVLWAMVLAGGWGLWRLLR